jgi:hypothetical protein
MKTIGETRIGGDFLDGVLARPQGPGGKGRAPLQPVLRGR